MSKAESISKEDIDILAKAIAAAPQPHGFSATQFCQLWSQARPLLETLAPVVRLIPGVGLIISAALTTLLAAGNAAHSAICGN